MTNARSEVWRHSTPCFTHDTGSGATRMIVPAPESGSILTYTDSSATLNGGTYYTVLGIDALDQPSDPSNYVGVLHPSPALNKQSTSFFAETTPDSCIL